MKEFNSEKIERYIKGIADDSEKAFMDSLFLKGEDNLYLRDCLKKDWDQILNGSSSNEVNLDQILDRIHHTIRQNENQKKQKPFHKFVTIYMRAAAILILPLLIAGGLIYSYLSDKYQTINDYEATSVIYAPLGSRVTFNLPDGTTGKLNSGSSLAYSVPFIKNRHVRLEGEAWFEVSHDENHPFEISTGTSTVKVLGTSFNMSAYPAENYVELVLLHGKVEFLNSNTNEKITILPSERLVFQNGNTSKSVIDPLKYNAWKDGKLVFRGDPMAEVARRIERWYNVNIELSDRELDRYSFRATFQDDKLEDVLRYLSLTSPINYRITPREQLPDGTFSKEKVTIFLKK